MDLQGVCGTVLMQLVGRCFGWGPRVMATGELRVWQRSNEPERTCRYCTNLAFFLCCLWKGSQDL